MRNGSSVFRTAPAARSPFHLTCKPREFCEPHKPLFYYEHLPQSCGELQFSAACPLPPQRSHVVSRMDEGQLDGPGPFTLLSSFSPASEPSLSFFLDAVELPDLPVIAEATATARTAEPTFGLALAHFPEVSGMTRMS